MGEMEFGHGAGFRKSGGSPRVLIHALEGIVGSRSGVDGTIDDAKRSPIQGLP